jgi:hypothetical protein
MKQWVTTPSGTRFGMLIVLGPGRRERSREGWYFSTLRLKCDCGRVITIRPQKLSFYRSCGCRKGKKPGTDLPSGYRHGHAYTTKVSAEYRAWCNMLQRCYDKHVKEFKNYGARGIRVCPRWRRSFQNFLLDMGPKPSPKYSLDRRNNSRGYSKRNCRWTTKHEQTRNTRRNIYITIDGVRLTVADWTKKLGVSEFRIYSRLRAGWKPRDAVLAPKMR